MAALSGCSRSEIDKQTPQAVVVEQPVVAPDSSELTKEQQTERFAFLQGLDYVIPCPEKVDEGQSVATAFSAHLFGDEPESVTFGRLAFHDTSAIWFTASQTEQGVNSPIEIVRHAMDFRMPQPPTNEPMGVIYPSEIPVPTPSTEIFPPLTDNNGVDSYTISIMPVLKGGSVTLRATCELTHNGIAGVGGLQST